MSENINSESYLSEIKLLAEHAHLRPIDALNAEAKFFAYQPMQDLDYLREIGFKSDFETANIRFTIMDLFQGNYSGRQASEKIEMAFFTGYPKICHSFKILQTECFLHYPLVSQSVIEKHLSDLGLVSALAHTDTDGP